MSAPAPVPPLADPPASAGWDRSRAASPDPAPTWTEPARRLPPSPGPDRSWRVMLTVLGAALVALTLAGMTTYSLVGWAVGRSYSEVPALHGLGTPTALELTTDVADVQVIRSEQAQEVSVALVPAGATTLPAADAEVRARVEVGGTAEDGVVDVSQPGFNGPIPWQSPQHDVLVEIPADHVMSLEMTSGVGDIRAQGEYLALSAASDVGEIRLSSIAAPDGVRIRSDLGGVDLDLAESVPAGVVVTSSVGTVEVRLAPEATGDVSITTDVGDATLEAPGTGRWTVDARSEVGTVHTERDLTASDGSISGTLTVHAEVGDVTVTR